MERRWMRVCAVALCAVVGCSDDDGGSPRDAGSGGADTGRPGTDAGSFDAGPRDAAIVDTGPRPDRATLPSDDASAPTSCTDETGFTTLTPPAEAKRVYVSSSTGNDENTGTMAAPVRTIAHAVDLMESRSASWLLLKRGDVFEEGLGHWKINGSSESDRAVVTSYGELSLPRPILRTGPDEAGVYIGGGGGAPARASHIALVGLHFYAHTRDPGSSTFETQSESTPLRQGIFFLRPGEDLLVEDCHFAFYGVNLVVQAEGEGLRGFRMRRNVVVDSYGYSTGDIYHHSQGIYMSNVHDALIEENVFDHNGWNETVPTGRPTIYNHNLYLQNGNSEVVVRRNVIARGAATGTQLRPGGVMDNNLYIGNSIAAFVARDDEPPPTLMQVLRDNVVLHGSNHFVNAPPANSPGPRCWGLDMIRPEAGSIATGNVVAHAPSGCHAALRTEGTTTVSDNAVWMWGSETTSGASYPNPERNVLTYQTSRGETATVEAFLQGARAQRRGSYCPEVTASVVNDYVREGFGR